MSALVEVPAEIRGLLLPLNRHPLLLPNAAVTDIIDFHRLVPVQDSPEWVAGATDWRRRKLPVVRFERLLGEEVAASQRQRIVVCHTLNPEAKWPFIGIAASAIPRLTRVREEILAGETLPDQWKDLPLCAALRVDGQPALIPDLPALEERLAQVAAIS